MRLALGFAVIVFLSACQNKPAEIQKCEALLLPTLKAPSTYKLIDHTIGLPTKDGSRNVFLTYDAVNSYNAPIRGTFWCVIDKGGAIKSGDEAAIADDLDMTADNLERMADNVAATANAPSPSPSATKTPELDDIPTDDEVPVCDQPDSPEKSALMNEIGVDCQPH